MEREARYPDYIGISDVNTKSFEQMRVEGYFDGQPSIMFDEPEGFDIGDPPDLHLQPKYEQINFRPLCKEAGKDGAGAGPCPGNGPTLPSDRSVQNGRRSHDDELVPGGVEKAAVRRQISYWTGQDSGGKINREAEETDGT